jgi:ABC-2 type transport system permease protein
VLVLACPLIAALVVDRLRLHPALGEGLLMAVAAAAALLAFVICCVAVGGVGALLLARLIPLLRRGIKGIVALAGVALAIGAVVALGAMERRGEPTLLVSEIVGHLRFAQNPYLPPWWAEQGLSAALDGRWWDWAYHLGLLLSTAATVALAGEWLAGRRLRLDLDALTGRPEARGAGRSRPWRLLPLLPADLALLAAKDLRLFLREPAQVLQFTMFFSILGFYLLMLPRIGKTFLFDEWWRPAVSLLNLTAVAMALATFTGRFVYPLLSLEGRRLWVLALAPWPRARVVTAKFVFALLVGLPAGVVLVALSGTMLELRPVVVVYQALTIACMAVGFTAGALGLGARLADYTEDNPAKLVAGYGGTINLMSSLAFTGLLLCGAAFPLLSEGRPGFGPWRWGVGLAWTLGITAVWTRVFMGMAWRWFGRLG